MLLALCLLLGCLAGCGKAPLPTAPAGTGGSTDITLPSVDLDFAQTDDTMFTELDLPLGKESCGLIALNGACRRERRQS